MDLETAIIAAVAVDNAAHTFAQAPRDYRVAMIARVILDSRLNPPPDARKYVEEIRSFLTKVSTPPPL